MDCTTIFNDVSELPRQIARLEEALQECEQAEPPRDCSQIQEDIDEKTAELQFAQRLQPVCEVIVGSYNFDGNGFAGTIQLSADISPDLTAHVTGTAVIDSPHVDTIDGSYDGNTGVLTFVRTGDDNNARFQPQQYFGRLFARGATTFAGVFATGASPALDSLTKGWFMVKQ